MTVWPSRISKQSVVSETLEIPVMMAVAVMPVAAVALMPVAAILRRWKR